MTRTNVLVGAGVVVGVLVLVFVLMNALDSDEPEAAGTTTTSLDSEPGSTLSSTPSTTTSTSSTSTSTTLDVSTTTTTEDYTADSGTIGGGSSGGGGGNGGSGGGVTTTTTTTATTTTTSSTTTTTTTPANLPPSANGQSVTTIEDEPGVSITLTGSDPQGTALTFQVATQPSSGALSGTAPNRTYTPDPDEFGADSFTFTVSSGGQTSAPATVSINVTPVDDDPVAVDDTSTATEDVDLVLSATGTGSPAANDTDVDGDTLSVTDVSAPTGGTVVLAGGQITFTPTPDLCGAGAGSFDYEVSDGAAPTDTGQVTVDITCVNDAPVADDETATTDEDTTVDDLDMLTGDIDVDGDTLDVTAVGPTSNGGAAVLNPDDTVDFVPGASFQDLQVGSQRESSFTYTVSDGQGGTDTGLVTITVTGVNDAPIANDDTGTTPEATPLVVSAGSGVLTNDTDVDAADTQTATTFSGTLPSGAAFTLNSDGSYTYDPTGVPAFDDLDTGESLDDTFTYTVTDSQGASDTALLTITVTGVDFPPVAADVTETTAEDTSVVVALSATDADDDDLIFSILTGPSNGSLSAIGTADCTTTANTCTADVTYTPDDDFSGAEQFTYEVSDGVNTDTATVDITVTPVNDAPVITLSGSTPTFTENGAAVTVDGGLTVADVDDTDLVSGTVSISVGSVAGDTLGFTSVGGITDGDAAPDVLALSGTTTVANWQSTLRSVQFTTASDNPTNATRTVSFTVNDGELSSALVSKDVTVVPVNDPPVLTQPDGTAITYTENDPATVIAPNITAVDVDNATLVGATIDIDTGFATGQDVLSLGTNPQNGIAATYNATTGMLTLSGTSSVANYQTALRDVRYVNSSNDPSSATRIISFQVDDGSDPSNIVSRNVDVTPVNDPPTAVAHNYTATANMAIDIPATSGLLTGAADFEAGTTLTVGTVGATTPAGGSITNLDIATGAFRFNPPPGVTGPVTFTYTVCDNGNPGPSACSAPTTVTFSVSGPVIWFVNGGAAAGGSGRLTDPFQTITAASTAIGANTNHRVFAYSGTYTGQGIALNSGGWLVGQQVTATSFDAVMGITPPAGTVARPAIATGSAALGNTLTLNTNATVRGIAVNSGTNTAISGSGGLTGVDVAQTTTNTTSGSALSLNNVAGTVSLSNAFKSSGNGVGISLTNVAANVSILAGGLPGSPAAVDIDGGTGTFTTAGSVSSGTGRPVEITNRNTGSPGLIQFTGGVTGNGTSTGILLDNNDNGVVTFAGGLTLNTGSNTAFTAINGGTVNVTDPNGPGSAPNNTIITSTGTALTVANTNIGGSGLNFTSISANGAANGVVLNNTGTSGRLVINGDLDGLPDGGGGLIQNTTSHGVQVTSALGPTITDLSVVNAGDANNEYGMFRTNVSGATTLDDMTFNGAADNLVHLTTMNVNSSFTVTGSLFSYPTVVGGTANSAILLLPGGTSSLTASVTGSTFTNIVSASTQIGADTLGASGNLALTFSGNTVNVTLPARAGGLVVSGQENTTTNLTIGTASAPNTFNGAGGNGVISIDVNDSSLVTGTISNNTITNAPGIGIFSAVDEGATSTLTFNANTVTSSGGDGMQLVNFGGVGSSTMNATVTNNLVNGHSLNTSVNFVGGISVTGFEDVMDLQLTGNTVTGTPAGATQCGGAPCVDYYLEEVGGTFRLEEIPDTAAITADQAYINSTNDPGPVTIFGTIELSNGVEISAS